MDPRTLLQRYRLSPKKHWGQNFLCDPDLVHQMVELLDIQPTDQIVELGAGTGALTELLSARSERVVAIERDRDLVDLLRQEFTSSAVDVLAADASQISLAELAGEGDLLVIGNLPYNISSPILFHLLEQRALFRRAILMLQKEVADRLTAQPGDGKDYSVLSIRFGVYFDIQRMLFVSRNSFYPRPQVDSVVLRFDPLPVPRVPIADETWFARTVKAAFARRRKTLQNNLIQEFPLHKDALLAMLHLLQIDPQRRGETLTPAEFALLAKQLQENVEVT